MPTERIQRLVEAATTLFIRKGYRRTQMADVTTAMGLSPGAVYRYVESKEALFDLVVRAGASGDLRMGEIRLPIPTPSPGATVAFLRETLKREGRLRSLGTALTRGTVDNPRAELESIVRELYAKTARYHVGIKLVERSALDWPELADLWFGRLRSDLINQLARYLELRIDHGLLRSVPDATAAARLIVETVAFFAMHRHGDPFPTPMDETVAENTAVDALVNAYAKEIEKHE